MQQFREVSRTRTIYSTETHAGDLIRSEMGSLCSFCIGLASGICLCCCWLLLYSTILHSVTDSLRLHVILHESIVFFNSACLNIHQSGVLTALAWLVPNWKPSSSHSISILTNIGTKFLLQSVCVCVCVCVCSALLYVNCFGRIMLYMCIEYHM